MPESLRVLLVEDSENDALLIIRQLSKGGYDTDYTRVFNQHDLDNELRSQHWDIVISDHNMPNFSSDLALSTVRKFDKDLPVILVSGTIGEEMAVKAMRDGAHDYIMKNNLARLVPAVQRELRESVNRKSQREAEKQIHYMAKHDALTGLINRFGFENKLQEMLDSVSDNIEHAFLYIDLDQFKIVNDTSGHVAGDELLRQLSRIMEKEIRANDTLARLGGDEFGVLLNNCPLTVAQSIAENLIKTIKSFHFSWQEKTFTLSASIGLVVIDQHYRGAAEIMSAADLACYSAKDSGRNRLHIYQTGDADIEKHQLEMEWVTRIQQAIDQDQFQLYKQCISPLNNAHQHMNCCEFLLRLYDNDETILPGAFIPAAERYNLMPDIDRWVIDHVMAYMAGTKSETSALAFVNLSGSTINDIALTSYISDKLKQHKVPAHQICFEITETTAISNFGAAIKFIEEIRNMGCLFALDDFGTGMSSFSYLRSLPVDFLKIDGEFIRNMDNNKMDRAIVEAINSIGHVANLKTIGEHAESEKIIQNLKDLNVDFAQGYAIEKPYKI